MKILDINEHNRPRERLREHGATALSEAELLAIILRTGSQGENVLVQAQRILSQFENRGLSRATLNELEVVEGLGTAKASQIVAAFELARRVERVTKPTIIQGREDAVRYCQPLIGHLEQEHFLVVWLDARNQVLGHEIVTKGLIDSCPVHPREVFRGAIKANAHSIIVAHNHPSQEVEPSNEDIQVAHAIRNSAMLIEMNVIDQFIVTENKSISLNDLL